MRKPHKRLVVVSSAAVVLGAAIVLAMIGLREQTAFFRTPSEVIAAGDAPEGAIRVGGLVTLGSVRTSETGIVFELADDIAAMEVAFAGVLPSLFREGQCVLAEGRVGADGRLAATRVIAKHDETYQAPEITEAPRLAQSCGSPASGAMSEASPSSAAAG